MTAADAIALLHALHADLPTPPPSVRRVKTHELNLADPVFDALKEDYPGFEDWFKKAARSQRDALVIDGDQEHAAIAILKPEPEGAYGLTGPLLKVCTFKVSDHYSGQKYGELLLKTVFRQAHVEHDAGIYMTVFEKHEQLIELVEDFGFQSLEQRSDLGSWSMPSGTGRCLSAPWTPQLPRQIRPSGPGDTDRTSLPRADRASMAPSPVSRCRAR